MSSIYPTSLKMEVRGLTKKAAVFLGPRDWPLTLPGPALPQWQRYPLPHKIALSFYKDQQFLISFQQEAGSPGALRCHALLRPRCFWTGPAHLPAALPPPLSPELSLQPKALASEVSGRDQTNFLLNIHKQNKTCLKQGNASFCASSTTHHFKSSSLSGTVWDQILTTMHKNRIPQKTPQTGGKLPHSTKGTEPEGRLVLDSVLSGTRWTRVRVN